MEQTLSRPVDYDTWSKSAQLAYDAVMLRALRAEKSLEDVQHQLHATPSQFAAPQDTLTWQTLMLRTMNEVFQEAANNLNPEQIFDTVTRTIGSLLEATSVYVCDWHSDTKTCTVFSQYIGEKANTQERNSLLGEVFQHNADFERKLQQDIWVSHPHEADLSDLERREFLENNIKTILYVPMRAKDELIGFIEVWDTRKEREFQHKQIEFVTSIVSQIAGSVRMAQLHRALQESEARFRLLMNTMRGGLVQVDRNGNIVFTNQRFAEFLEMQQESLIGQNLEILWEQVAESNRHEESRLVQSNGNVFWFHISRSQLSSERGQVLGAVYVYTDITKRKEAEQQAIDLALEKERVSLLSQFVQDASHEFYTPLSVMKTQVYLLERRLGEDEKAAERLLNLNNQILVMQDLVEALVLMSKLDSTRSLNLNPYRMNILLEQIADEMRPHIAAKGQYFHLEISKEVLFVDCDAGKLQIAIKELLDNASRYTPEAGQIILRLYAQDEDVIIEVRDTGLGISAEEQERVFERFYRSDKAHSTRGFGLGLSIVKRIVSLHHAEIQLQSEANTGSRFRIILKMSEAT